MRAEAARRGFFDSLRGVLPPRQISHLSSSEWVPLAEAAEALRQALKGSDLDRISRGLSESDDSLLAFWAHRVAKSGVPVYGCRIMATTLEVVPEAEIRAGKLLNQATRLDVGHGHPIQDVCALQVKRHDLEALLTKADSLIIAAA